MRLLEELERAIAAEPSLFRAQLLREDAARLRRLGELARASADLATFQAAGRRLGWTQGDQRTHEVGPELDALLEAVYVLENGAAPGSGEERVRDAWARLTRARVEKLVGCLSMPAPKPD